MHKPYLYAFGQYAAEISNLAPILMVFFFTAPMDKGTEKGQLESTLNSSTSFASSMPLCVNEDYDAVDAKMVTPTDDDEVIVAGVCCL